MKSNRSRLILAIGIYEILYSVRLLWNLANGRRSAIILADEIIRGAPAQIIFLAIAVAGLVIGYGIIRQRRWAFWSVVAFNGVLILLYVSNLLFVDQSDLLRFYSRIPDGYLTSYRLGTFRRLAIVVALTVCVLFLRKQFMKTLVGRKINNSDLNNHR